MKFITIEFEDAFTGKTIRLKIPDFTKLTIEEAFDYIWARYPRKMGKQGAFSHFKASVKNQENWGDICKALYHYRRSRRVQRKYIQDGKTWFNGRNWKDWIKPPKSEATRTTESKPQGKPEKSYQDKPYQDKPSRGKPRAKHIAHTTEQVQEAKKVVGDTIKTLADSKGSPGARKAFDEVVKALAVSKSIPKEKERR